MGDFNLEAILQLLTTVVRTVADWLNGCWRLFFGFILLLRLLEGWIGWGCSGRGAAEGREWKMK